MQARIGIHTGPVVVGQMGGAGKSETLAMGATTNVAARLQGLAQPHTVFISGATLKLVPGLFVARDLGAQTIKGIDKPLPIYQIIQPSGVRTRLEAAEHLTPFVGREQELSLLKDRWQRVQEGQGQAVLLSADAGMGKSRLLLTLRESITHASHTWLECRASPLTRTSAFQPIIELMHRGLTLKETDTAEVKLQRLEQALDTIGQDKQEAVPLLAPLLNLNLTKQYQPSSYGPELKRKKMLELLTGWLIALAQHQPLLLAVEDLHWADPSSLDLLALLLGAEVAAPHAHRAALAATAQEQGNGRLDSEAPSRTGSGRGSSLGTTRPCPRSALPGEGSVRPGRPLIAPSS